MGAAGWPCPRWGQQQAAGHGPQWQPPAPFAPHRCCMQGSPGRTGGPTQLLSGQAPKLGSCSPCLAPFLLLSLSPGTLSSQRWWHCPCLLRDRPEPIWG